MATKPSSASLDTYDRKILDALQIDGSLGPVELSNRIALSVSQCSRRLQRLRERGMIASTVALLDGKAMNLRISAILLVTLANHSPENEQNFLDRIQSLSEVTACHYVTGELDFILNVVTRDLETYEDLLRRRILPAAEISSCRSNIILRTNKNTTALPLTYA
jgi:Lrp/AsnC family transcriptional regulator, leucine-responsive regulatory protein